MPAGQSPRRAGLLLDTNVVLAALLWNGLPLRLLEHAVEDEIEMIVSGDHHLLDLGSYAGMPILTVRQALAQITQV